MKMAPWQIFGLMVLCATAIAQSTNSCEPAGFTASSANRQRESNSTPHSPNPGQAKADKRQQRDVNQQETTGTSNDRLFWTLPNFLTVQSKNIPPLTPGQKFKIVTRTSFDPVEAVYVGFLAGIGQAVNSEPGFGQGAAGYGKRFAAGFGDIVIENFMTGAVLPSIFKQDPRFYQLGHGSFTHRTRYAVSRLFLTRSDSGHTQFNFSEVLGSAISAGVSTYSYHPREDRTVANALSVWGTQLGWDTMTVVLKEFWPDIQRRISKRKTAPSSSAP